jgi:hypothetical protein
MLIRRDRSADHGKAVQLLDQALAAARTLGLARLAQEIAALQELGAGALGAVEGYVFRREGDFWTVAYGGSVVRVRDSKGLRHLARLLAQPAREPQPMPNAPG